MEVAQLNARLDANIKREGDATLARYGVSATEAIRALWTLLAKTKALPSFLQAPEPQVSAEALGASEMRSASADCGAGMALAMARERGLVAAIEPIDYDELRRLAFDEMVAEGDYRV